MDDKLFDKLIKEKAESHIDPSKPSGAEISRLFDQLPPSTGGSWFSSTTNRVVSVAATTLLILTIFLVYRTFRLEETIELLDERFQNTAVPQTNIIYQYDTTTVDSLAKLSIRLNNRLDSLLSTQSAGRYRSYPNQSAGLAVDSDKVANAVMAQLIQQIQSDPALMDQIREQLGLNESYAAEENEQNEPKIIVLSSGTVAKRLVEKDLADQVLADINSDPEKAEVISNLLAGNEPDEADAISMNLTDDDLESLSDSEKEELLKEYLEYDPKSVQSALEKSDSDEDTKAILEEYVAIAPIKNKKLQMKDSIALADRLADLEDVRDEQAKARDRSILLGGGVGIGRLPFEDFGTVGTTSFKLTGEYQPNARFGFATGIEYYRTEGESYDIANFDLTRFDDLELGDSEIDEIKLNMQWLDIPLEAKLYFKKGKISPYAIVSVRARALLKESYKFETDEDDLSPSVDSNNGLIFPSYGYGIGSQFYLNPKFNGALQLQHSIGGNGIGASNQQLNTIQLQGIIYFDLK